MKLLPTMVSEAAASTYKHHLFGAAAPTSTQPTTEEHEHTNYVDSPRRCLQKGSDVAAAIARLETRSKGFLPEGPNPLEVKMELHNKRLQGGNDAECAAAAGTDKVDARLSPETPPN